MSPVTKQIRRELLAVLAFALIMVPYVVMFEKLGWLGFWITSSILTGSLLIHLVGLPKVLTADFRLPADTRQRLGWEPENPTVDRGNSKG